MTTPEPDQRRLALVYNPIKVDEARLRASVSRLAAEAGWPEPAFHTTTVDDAGQGCARDALDAGATAVLVAGGDGTVRAVAEAMAGTGIPLGIVPSGTGNLLARNIGLPLSDAEAIIRAAIDGRTLAIDIGWARLTRTDGTDEEHAFVVLAGMGLDADMIANTRPDLKKSVGWVAYVDGAARSLVAAKPFRIVYQVDESRLHSAKAHSVLFANCGMLPAGISLVPTASITDGALDIAVIQPAGPLGWFGVWRKIWWDNSILRRSRIGRLALERRGKNASVRYLHGLVAEAAATEPTPIELDGDEFGRAVRIVCRVDPDALLLAVPEGITADAL
ncbi:diacylglycerol/lipid kinase family protein [Microbacterium sp. NPDC055903]